MGTHPSRRGAVPGVWHARAGATVDTLPLPARTAARTRAIRHVFLDELHGRATLDEVGRRCDALQLLESLQTWPSAYETLRQALRPIAAPCRSQSAWGATYVSAQTAPG